MNKAWQTRRFNQWDKDSMDKWPHKLTRWRRIPALRKLLEQIWFAEAEPLRRMTPPRLIRSVDFSYFWTTRFAIALTDQQQCLGILLHEIAHALTPKWADDHGPSFQRTYKYLLYKYGGYEA